MCQVFVSFVKFKDTNIKNISLGWIILIFKLLFCITLEETQARKEDNLFSKITSNTVFYFVNFFFPFFSLNLTGFLVTYYFCLWLWQDGNLNTEKVKLKNTFFLKLQKDIRKNFFFTLNTIIFTCNQNKIKKYFKSMSGDLREKK